MNGDADWQKEMDAQAERNARKAQEAAEDIVERMRALQIALALMGRAEDARLVGQALEPMKEVAGVQRMAAFDADAGLECFCLLNEARDLLAEALDRMHEHELPGRGRAAGAMDEAGYAIAALEALLRQRGAL